MHQNPHAPIDPEVLALRSGLFDSLPPPPRIDSLIPLAAPVELPVPALARPGSRAPWLAAAVGAATLALVGFAARPAAPAPERAVAAVPRVDARIVVTSAPVSYALARQAPKPTAAPRALGPKPRATAAPAAAPPPADLPVAAAAAPPPVADLDRATASRAVAAAARSAAVCLESDDTRTSMPVTVIFAPSGRVTTATIDGGPFLGTAAGGCIARSLRAASVTPFAGEPVAVHTTVRLR